MRPGNDRGQTGIGTIVILIALMLIATVTAGVMFDVAGVLQSQSDRTGAQSGDQVTGRLQAVNTVGNVTDNGSYICSNSDPPECSCWSSCHNVIDWINLTVKKTPGGEDIRLRNTTVLYVRDKEVVTLVHENSSQGAATDATFSTTALVDPDGSISESGVLNEPEDRARIELHVDPRRTTFETLNDSREASIVLTSGSTAQTQVNVLVPESLANETRVDL